MSEAYFSALSIASMLDWMGARVHLLRYYLLLANLAALCFMSYVVWNIVWVNDSASFGDKALAFLILGSLPLNLIYLWYSRPRHQHSQRRR
jgi:hypothetical protein